MKNDYLWSLTKKTNVCKITVAECICIYTLYATTLEQKKKNGFANICVCVCIYIYANTNTNDDIIMCISIQSFIILSLIQ